VSSFGLPEPVSQTLCEKRASFSQLLLGLSRACLGKMILFVFYKVAQKWRFQHLVGLTLVQPGRVAAGLVQRLLRRRKIVAPQLIVLSEKSVSVDGL
jgi:hypothetical protein